MLVGTALRRAKLSSARLSGELLTVSPQLALTTPINFVDRVWSLRAETRSTAPIRVKTIKWSKLSRARQPSRPVFSWGAGGRITYPVMGRLGLSLGRTVWVARQLRLTRMMLPPPLAVIDAAPCLRPAVTRSLLGDLAHGGRTTGAGRHAASRTDHCARVSGCGE